MIHCIDCDDEECALMPYCLDYQDLLVHMEECTEKKCRMKVRFYTDELLRVVRDLSHFIFLNQCRKEADPTYKDSEFEFSIDFKSVRKFIVQFQSRCMSDPPFSDIDFKNKMAWVWTTLNSRPPSYFWFLVWCRLLLPKPTIYPTLSHVSKRILPNLQPAENYLARRI